jgi:membrane protein DedA with SNARE-associated domain
MNASFGGVPEAAALFALTFLSEDAAVLSAAVMVAAGVLPLEMGFAACFLGIWLGDLWLYAMARAFGAPFVARFGVTPGVQRSRAWFEERGSLVLIVSRFIPGLRLPSYLAAGAMRFPLRTFTLVTGVVAAIWVAVIFAGSRLLGVAKVPFIREHALWLAGGAVAVAGTSMVAKSLLRKLTIDCRWHARVARWMQWEFWPAWLFYTPVAVFYLWLALRYRGLTLPTAANPGIPMGGLVGESKFATLDALQRACPGAVAQTWLIAPGSSDDRFAELHIIVESHAVALPFILKPDVGQRGVGVKLIRSLPAAREYLEAVTVPVLLQRYAPGPREAGVFYYRLPGEATGHIFAITEKLFPVVRGDGERTLEELILVDSRAAIVAETYLRRFDAQRHWVPACGETVKLVEAGNHVQGCVFRDGMHLATPALLAAIERISQSIPGFFIGRYDLRHASDEDLRDGRGFTILELNGASAEATSIYDARNSLFAAYRTLYQQWALVFRIGALNRVCGAQPASHLEIWRAWRRTNAAIRTYPMAD